MYRKQVRRRRAVLVALIVISLVLLSSQFSEADSGPLHTIQRGVATVFSPFGEVAERALKPGRDLINWVDETFEARGENEDLKAEVAKLRAEVVASEDAAGDNEQFRKLLELRENGARARRLRPRHRPCHRALADRLVLRRDDRQGVERGDSSATTRSSTATGWSAGSPTSRQGTAKVELITDHDNAVSAQVLPSGPTGIVEPEVGNPSDLLLDFIDSSETIQTNQTAGDRRLVGHDRRNLLGLPGRDPDRPRQRGRGRRSRASSSASTSSRSRTCSSLDYLQVLTGGPERPGVPG